MHSHYTVHKAEAKITPKDNKCKKSKGLSEEILQIAKEIKAKSKGERKRYAQQNAKFQRIARRGKKTFLNEQSKEVEENNRMGKTGGLLNKIVDTQWTLHAGMGMIKTETVRK